MERRKFTREFKLEAVRLIKERGVSYASRPRSQRSRSDEELGAKVRSSFLASDRTYGARRIWHDMLAEGVSCGLHRIERLMRLQALKARPRRRRLPPDLGERQAAAVAPNVLDRNFEAPAQRLEAGPGFRNRVEDVEQVARRSGEPVKPRHPTTAAT
jgi:transposase InsO family protein